MPKEFRPPRKLSALRRIFNWLLLRPYEERLLTDGARWWTSCGLTIVTIMALVESTAWTYLAAHISRSHSLVAASFVGVAMFLIVWIFDSTFLTVDTARSYYEQILNARTDAEDQAWLAKNKYACGLLLRLVVLSGTLYMSAPYLAMGVYSGDIASRIDTHNSTQIADARRKLAATFDHQIEQLQHRREEGQTTMVAEAVGRKLQEPGRQTTGIPGFGPGARAMKSVIDDQKDEIASAQAAKQQALRAFDQAATNQRELASRYGIPFLDDTLQTRQKILDEIVKERNHFGQADLAVKGFLLFLFISMIALKQFAPRSIRIYYSENLQGHFISYLQGNFNTWITEQEYPDSPAGGMTPQRFEDWVTNTYSAIREEDEKRRRRDQLENDYRRKIEPLEKIEGELVQKLVPRKAELSGLRDDRLRLECDLAASDADVARSDEAVASLQMNREEIMALFTKGNGLGGSGLSAVMERIDIISSKLERARDDVRSSQLEKADYAKQLDLLTTRISAMTAEIDAIESTLSNVRAAIQKALDDFTEGLRRL